MSDHSEKKILIESLNHLEKAAEHLSSIPPEKFSLLRSFLSFCPDTKKETTLSSLSEDLDKAIRELTNTLEYEWEGDFKKEIETLNAAYIRYTVGLRQQSNRTQCERCEFDSTHINLSTEAGQVNVEESKIVPLLSDGNVMLPMSWEQAREKLNDSWPSILLAVNEYAVNISDSAMHQSASKADIAQSAALASLAKLRKVLETLFVPSDKKTS